MAFFRAFKPGTPGIGRRLSAMPRMIKASLRGEYDGIVASGGNTLNQQAIWKAQGIDVILRQAWDRGIVLGGASAGSLCWFEEGTTDSRPKELTTVKCLGFLKGAKAYYVSAAGGQAVERPLEPELLE